MNMGDLPLTKIFWSIFALEALVVAIMLIAVGVSFSSQRGPDSGLVGAWIILIPIVVMALVAGVFYVAQAPWVRVTCVVVLLWPVIGSVITAPILLTGEAIGARVDRFLSERARHGQFLFPEAGQRKLASAIADRDVEKIKAALPGAGDLNRQYSENLPYGLPLGDNQTLLSFACEEADESDDFAQVIRLLLAAGADPNLPPGKPLTGAIFRSTRATAILLEAGANPNAIAGFEDPVWWYVLERVEPGTERLQLLLAHGADITKRKVTGPGPIEHAAHHEDWSAVWLLAQRIPGGRDQVIGRDGETVHARLSREVKSLRELGQPIPEDMIVALSHFDAAAK